MLEAKGRKNSPNFLISGNWLVREGGLHASPELRKHAHLPFVPLGWSGLEAVTSGTTRGERDQWCQNLLPPLKWGPENELQLQVGKGKMD